MAAEHNRPGDDAADAERLSQLAGDLVAAVEVALPGWVERSVERVAGAPSPELRRAAADEGRRAVAAVGAELRALLSTDVDQQRTNPLSVLRGAVRHPTRVLTEAGVAPVRRSEFDERAFPDDVYGLAPATWADVDPALQEPGVLWGAAKAHVVLARRRREARR